MEIFDPGHLYGLCVFDNDTHEEIPYLLQFMKREGAGYPGNVGHFPGTNIQEVIRACIDRIKYLNHQEPCGENQWIISHLREALVLLEQRAAFRDKRIIAIDAPIETILTCPRCGHIQCRHMGVGLNGPDGRTWTIS